MVMMNMNLNATISFYQKCRFSWLRDKEPQRSATFWLKQSAQTLFGSLIYSIMGSCIPHDAITQQDSQLKSDQRCTNSETQV